MKINNETKVGILAAISITLLILGFNLLKSEKLFVSGFELKAYYNNVSGLSTGNPVIYNGFTVGQVKSISFADNESGQLEVVFSMKKDLRIPVDSRAVIANADLLGSKSIRIDRGFSGSFAESGSVLTGDMEESLEQRVIEEILPLKNDIGELISQMERFMGWLNNTMDESTGNKIDNILNDFTVMSRNLSRTSGKVNTLMDSFQATAENANKVVRNLKNQNETITQIMGNTAQFTDSLAAASSSVKDIVESSAASIESLQGILAEIENGDGTISKILKEPELYDNLQSSSERLDSLLTKFQESPRIPVDVTFSFGDPKKREQRIELREKRRLRRLEERNNK